MTERGACAAAWRTSGRRVVVVIRVVFLAAFDGWGSVGLPAAEGVDARSCGPSRLAAWMLEEEIPRPLAASSSQWDRRNFEGWLKIFDQHSFVLEEELNNKNSEVVVGTLGVGVRNGRRRAAGALCGRVKVLGALRLK